MNDPVLTTRDLCVAFGGHQVVKSVTSQFFNNELTAIVGPNGAGKTTLFNLISGQVRATSGKIILNNSDVTRASVAARSRLGLGRVFQLTSLFSSLTVFENVRLAVQARRDPNVRLFSLAERDSVVMGETRDTLERVRLDHLQEWYVNELSHGNQRKLEVALLMAMKPKVYMFDEPTAGMSADDAPVILDLIAELKQDSARCIMMVEHKMDVIGALADRVIVLHNGELVADGKPQEVMSSEIVQAAYLGSEFSQ